MLGLKIAQLALEFGANDLDGTVVTEKIVHSAGAESAQELTKEELIEVIKEAGKTPAERDTFYNVLCVYN